MSVRWGRTAAERARSVTTSPAATAVTVRRATSTTPSAKPATVRMAAPGPWDDDEQIGGFVVRKVGARCHLTASYTKYTKSEGRQAGLIVPVLCKLFKSCALQVIRVLLASRSLAPFNMTWSESVIGEWWLKAENECLRLDLWLDLKVHWSHPSDETAQMNNEYYFWPGVLGKSKKHPHYVLALSS